MIYLTYGVQWNSKISFSLQLSEMALIQVSVSKRGLRDKKTKVQMT